MWQNRKMAAARGEADYKMAAIGGDVNHKMIARGGRATHRKSKCRVKEDNLKNILGKRKGLKPTLQWQLLPK